MHHKQKYLNLCADADVILMHEDNHKCTWKEEEAEPSQLTAPLVKMSKNPWRNCGIIVSILSSFLHVYSN